MVTELFLLLRGPSRESGAVINTRPSGGNSAAYFTYRQIMLSEDNFVNWSNPNSNEQP